MHHNIWSPEDPKTIQLLDDPTKIVVLYTATAHYGFVFRTLDVALDVIPTEGRSASFWRGNRLVATYSPKEGIRRYA